MEAYRKVGRAYNPDRRDNLLPIQRRGILEMLLRRLFRTGEA